MCDAADAVMSVTENKIEMCRDWINHTLRGIWEYGVYFLFSCTQFNHFRSFKKTRFNCNFYLSIPNNNKNNNIQSHVNQIETTLLQ